MWPGVRETGYGKAICIMFKDTKEIGVSNVYSTYGARANRKFSGSIRPFFGG